MRKRFTLSYFIHFIGFLEFGFFALENNIQTAEILDNLIGRTILAVSCFWLFSPQSLDWLFQYVYSTLSQTRKIHVWWCFWGTWWKLYAKCSFTVAPHLTLASKGVGVSFRRSKSSGPRKINHVVHRRNIRGWKTWGTLSVKSSIEILWIHLIWWKSNNPSEILARSQANSRRSAWLILLNLSSKFNSL